MIDTKICDWLMENADEPIRYRVARELLKDEQATKKIEHDFLENHVVQAWLKNLHPETPPPRHRPFNHGHGGFDFCWENGMLKAAQLGLHMGIQQVADLMEYYINQIESGAASSCIQFMPITLIAGLENKVIQDLMLNRLDNLYGFVRQGVYDIYYTEEETAKIKGIPAMWRDRKVIKREFSQNDLGYPLIYDVVGLHTLYHLNKPEITRKIDAVIQYISTDEFHDTIDNGYGIVFHSEKTFHSMGWDPKYPGWFDVAEHIENYNRQEKSNSDRGMGVLFFAQYIAKYPPATKTKWFNDLISHLEKYKTENNTYIFPKELLPEKSGYAVGGNHMGFGENRRKKNWLEIESTFYMQLIQQNI